MLRPGFLAADMGITGANFIVAETGSALIVNSTAIGQVQPPPGLSNPCVVPTKTPISVAPGYGADHNFCSDDDPKNMRGVPQTLPAVTGVSIAQVININPGYVPTPGKPSPTPAPTTDLNWRGCPGAHAAACRPSFLP